MASEPKQNIFLTGATGFIGRVLVGRLLDSGFAVTCLVRDKSRLQITTSNQPHLTVLVGDLNDPATYYDEIIKGATVLHLAAATGAASAAELHSVNVDGTQHLVNACVAASVDHFVFVSSIAARFDDLDNYPYGQSKRDAEDVVVNSKLPYTILRPTFVFGDNSPIEEMLKKLASLPIIPVIGGGQNQVQPVLVSDLADKVAAIVNQPFQGVSTVEIGGPEVTTFRDLLQRMRSSAKDKRALAIPIPVWPIRITLKILSSVLGEKLPVSPGQLAPFTNNCAALLFNKPRNSDDECQTLFRYLFSRPADPYVLEKYADLTTALADDLQPANPPDERLLRIAQRGPFSAQLADCFARLFVPTGALRRRLSLLVAIAEYSPRHFAAITHGTLRALPLELAAMTLAGLRWMLMSIFAIVVLMPGHLVAKR